MELLKRLCRLKVLLLVKQTYNFPYSCVRLVAIIKMKTIYSIVAGSAQLVSALIALDI